MRRMTSSIRSLERSGPSCSPIAVDPTTSAISAVTILRSPVVVVTAIPGGYRRAWPLPARENGNRKVQKDVIRVREIGLEAGEDSGCSRGCCEQPFLHPLDGLEADELVRERLREAPAAEIPAVELLQEARRTRLAHLGDGVAHEEQKLRHDFLPGGRLVHEARDLCDRPRV